MWDNFFLGVLVVYLGLISALIASFFRGFRFHGDRDSKLGDVVNQRGIRTELGDHIRAYRELLSKKPVLFVLTECVGVALGVVMPLIYVHHYLGTWAFLYLLTFGCVYLLTDLL